MHPTCGPTQPGDIDGLVRIQTYEVMESGFTGCYVTTLKFSPHFGGFNYAYFIWINIVFILQVVNLPLKLMLPWVDVELILAILDLKQWQALKDETKQEFPMFRWAYLHGTSDLRLFLLSISMGRFNQGRWKRHFWFLTDIYMLCEIFFHFAFRLCPCIIDWMGYNLQDWKWFEKNYRRISEC